MKKLSLKLYASSKVVVTQFLNLPGENRLKNLLQRVEKLTETETDSCLETVKKDFAHRHRNLEQVFHRHFRKIENQTEIKVSGFSEKKKLLTGAFLTKEYSIQSAALFNPSIVPHPNQEGTKPGEIRFILSLRATGEGHISSIVFQTGTLSKTGVVKPDPLPEHFSCIEKNAERLYDKNFIRIRTASNPAFNKTILDILPESFTVAAADRLTEEMGARHKGTAEAISQLNEILDANYELQSSAEIPLMERVIFPSAKMESMGMEDLRLVKFIEGNKILYYGTYTAYNGKQIKTQLIETTDFLKFRISNLYGAAIKDKGMALFPEKINGKYAMISRQDGENIYLMYSDDLYCWENTELLMQPEYPWELVQLGNCGSPIKTSKGWLLLTHGVGALRTYVISAILLDLKDPSKILGRLDKPLIVADESEREGYVPNVVYTCGMLLHGEIMLIPYALSDSATGFVTIKLHDLLNGFELI